MLTRDRVFVLRWNICAVEAPLNAYSSRRTIVLLRPSLSWKTSRHYILILFLDKQRGEVFDPKTVKSALASI